MWLGHFEPWSTTLFYLQMGTALAFAWETPLVLAISFGIVFAVCQFAMIYHDSRLCVRCLHAKPLEAPQQAVDRRRRVLWLFHQRLLILAALLAAGVLLTAQALARDHPWLRVGAIFFLIVLFLLYASRVHRRLRLWCPFCHRGGDADGDDGDEPDDGPPDPSRERDLEPTGKAT